VFFLVSVSVLLVLVSVLLVLVFFLVMLALAAVQAMLPTTNTKPTTDKVVPLQFLPRFLLSWPLKLTAKSPPCTLLFKLPWLPTILLANNRRSSIPNKPFLKH
jgi:hypothetical protein